MLHGCLLWLRRIFAVFQCCRWQHIYAFLLFVLAARLPLEDWPPLLRGRPHHHYSIIRITVVVERVRFYIVILVVTLHVDSNALLDLFVEMDVFPLAARR